MSEKLGIESVKRLLTSLECFSVNDSPWGPLIKLGLEYYDGDEPTLSVEIAEDSPMFPKYKITDHGTTLSLLGSKGYGVERSNKKYVERILAYYGIERDGAELHIFTTEDEMGSALRKIASGLVATSGLYAMHEYGPYEVDEEKPAISFEIQERCQSWYAEPQRERVRARFHPIEKTRAIWGRAVEHTVDFALQNGTVIFAVKHVSPRGNKSGFHKFAMDFENCKVGVILDPEHWSKKAVTEIENLEREYGLRTVRYSDARDKGQLYNAMDEAIEPAFT